MHNEIDSKLTMQSSCCREQNRLVHLKNASEEEEEINMVM